MKRLETSVLPACRWLLLPAVIVLAGLLISVFAVRDTSAHVAYEQRAHGTAPTEKTGLRAAFVRGTFHDPVLRVCNQAGLVTI